VLVSALLALAGGAAHAAIIQLRASLNGDQIPLAVPGTGIGAITFDTVSKVLTWNVSYQNLSGPCTAAEFHGPAAAAVDADITVAMTCASPLVGSVQLDTTQQVQLLSGQWYINIHTDAHLNGEIRGQVVQVRGDFNGDGRSDVSWRNWSTGENYLYPMNGTTILPAEGYLRTVSDLNWKMAAFGDFDGDGNTDIFWRNASTGENYIYFMNGTSIVAEGYVRTVADQNWQVAGAGDFNGDGRADILWRNKSTGENYVYLMDGTTIAGEGYLRTVADQNWRVVGVGDFDGDGRADILWRNAATGENYIYPMNGTTILVGEGYLRTVADQNWRVAGVADFDGDGRADILWRNASTGENYIYPMAGLAIRSTEGYLRTVADLSWQMAALGDYNGDGCTDILWRNGTTGDDYIYFMSGTSIIAEGYLRTVADRKWSVAGAMPVISGQIGGLDFPSNADSQSNADSVRFRFTGSALMPIYGIDGAGVTYLWKYRPRQQTGYYTAFFWGNDDGAGTDSTFEWHSGAVYPGDSYYGMHPYPHDGTGPLFGTGTEHRWEISIEQRDYVDAAHPVVKGVWYSQAARVWGASGAEKNEEFYWNLPDTTTDVVTQTTPSEFGNTMPPSPALTWGDAPWNPSLERASGVLRGWQIYNALLTIDQITMLAACETDSCVLSNAASLGVLNSLWYLNMNPQDESDISDKSGAGHDPTWWNSNRPTRWTP
jgi:hypothetical protein